MVVDDGKYHAMSAINLPGVRSLMTLYVAKGEVKEGPVGRKGSSGGGSIKHSKHTDRKMVWSLNGGASKHTSSGGDFKETCKAVA